MRATEGPGDGPGVDRRSAPARLSPEREAGVPPFTIGGAVFTCWVALDQAGTPYVWRSACRRAAVGRVGAFCWARVDGRLIGAEYASLKTAMGLAALELAVNARRDAA